MALKFETSKEGEIYIVNENPATGAPMSFVYGAPNALKLDSNDVVSLIESLSGDTQAAINKKLRSETGMSVKAKVADFAEEKPGV
jgi:hypothetical protein